jgi:hypothetical protein
MNTLNFHLVLIADSDEPGDAVNTGLQNAGYEHVTLSLLPDGEPGDYGWFGTPPDEQGRPTAPVLVFYDGTAPSQQDVEEAISAGLHTMPHPFLHPSTARSDEQPISRHHANEAWATLPVASCYPPYPWLQEAQLGKIYGTHFTRVEWGEDTEQADGTCVTHFHFWNEAR